MDLQACPTCGAMAVGGAVECKFCGATIEQPDRPSAPAGWADSQHPPHAPPPRAWVPPAGTGTHGRGEVGPPGGPQPGGAGLPPSGPFALSMPPPLIPAPRRTRRPMWMLWGAIAVVGVVVVVAFTIRQVTDKKPLPGEQAAIDGVGEWTTFTDPNGAFAIDFPFTPTVGDEQASPEHRERLIGGAVLRVEFYVHYVDYYRGFTGGVYGEQFLDEQDTYFADAVGGTLRWSQRTAVGGIAALEYIVEVSDGVWHSSAVLTGKRLYFLQVFATVDASDGYRRFAASFRPLTPEK